MKSAHTNSSIITGLQSAQKDVSRKMVTIRWTLPLCVVAPLISGIALTGWLAFRSGQTAVEDLVDNISVEVATNIEKQVESYLDQPALVSAVLSAEAADNSLYTEDIRVLSKSLWQLTQAPLLTSNLYYGNTSGEFVYSGNQNGEARLDFVEKDTNFKRVTYQVDEAGNLGDSRTLSNYDPRVRPWYEKAKADRAAVWSPIYIDNTRQELTITRATPVFDQSNQLQGVFGIDIYLDELSNFMRELAISPNGQAFIIETSGELIASSANERPFLEQGDTQIRMAATSSQDPLIRETATQLNEKVTDLQSIPSSEVLEFELGGETQLAYIYRFQDAGVDWLIGITIPQSDYMETLHDNAEKTILIGVVVTAIASLIALGAALHIIHPIGKLNQAAYDIKNNRYVPDTLNGVMARFDEFSDLAQLFNDMATVVDSREQSLAEQVQALKSKVHQGGGSKSDRQKLEQLLLRSQRLRKHYREHNRNTAVR